MKANVTRKVHQKKAMDILHSFSHPKTPRQVERELGISNLKIKPFLDNRLLELLNAGARKGKLYTVTSRARALLGMPDLHSERDMDWGLTGWILASPKQRLAVLKAMDSVRRTSEIIRKRAAKHNPQLTRISVKTVLGELVRSGLIGTEKDNGKRYYWLREEGKLVLDNVNRIKA